MASAAQADEKITYSYDALGRLVATTNSGTANSGVTMSLGYDPAGNRVNYTVSGTGSATPPATPTPPAPTPLPPPPPPPPPLPPACSVALGATATAGSGCS